MRHLMLSAGLVLVSCAAHQRSDGSPAARGLADPNAEGEKLNALVEDYFEASLARNPIQATFIGDARYNHALPNSLSESFRRGQAAFDRHWLHRVTSEVDGTVLAGQDRLTYDVFVSQREQSIEGESYPFELLPISQMFSLPNFAAQLGSGQSAQPFANAADYDDWMKRARALIPIMDQMELNLRRGVEKGVVHPRVIMEKVLPQLKAHVVDSLDKSIFMMPLKRFPDDMADADKKRITEAHTALVKHSIIPAYRRLHDYIATEYLPSARETHGYWAHPDGAKWYAFLVKQNTTTDLTPDEIHAIGVKEVERIRSEMIEVARTVGFEGTLSEFFEYAKNEEKFYFKDKEALLQGYRDLQAKVNERLPKLFDIMPKADYEVRAVEAFREGSAAAASYLPGSPDGSRPGIFYVNTRDLKAQAKFGMETLSLHEASPGHHFQISIAQEVESLPRFRRFGGYTAYAEGWALYAESIGKEMGMFE
ncbi:MAG: DUF885 domain-containing protein, partial [Myxococcota bacterium]